MPVTYTNRKGRTYYLCRGVTKKGGTRYFFSREPKDAVLEEIPEGYEIRESVNGNVSLAKARPLELLQSEIDVVHKALNAHPKAKLYRLEARPRQITIYESCGPDFEEFLPLVKGLPGSVAEKQGLAERLQEDQYNSGQFSPIMRFILTDKEKRLFKAQRMCFRGSVEDWIDVEHGKTNLMQLSNIENLEGLLGILHNLVRSLGSHLEVSNFARESGVSHPTAKKYLNALDQAQLTFQLRGYHFGPAKRFIKATKKYFADNGIIFSLKTMTGQGTLLENFVISELEKRRKLGFIPTDGFYCYKSAAGHEIDLIFETRDSLYAIEVKSTMRPGRSNITSLMNFKPKKDLKVKRFLFYLGEKYKTVEDVQLIPAAALFRGR